MLLPESKIISEYFCFDEGIAVDPNFQGAEEARTATEAP
jgi:hypothetical protein